MRPFSGICWICLIVIPGLSARAAIDGEEPQRGILSAVVDAEHQISAHDRRGGSDASRFMSQQIHLLAGEIVQAQDIEIGMLGDLINQSFGRIDGRRRRGAAAAIARSPANRRFRHPGRINFPLGAAIKSRFSARTGCGTNGSPSGKSPLQFARGGFQAENFVLRGIDRQHVRAGFGTDGHRRRSDVLPALRIADEPPPEHFARRGVESVGRAFGGDANDAALQVVQGGFRVPLGERDGGGERRGRFVLGGRFRFRDGLDRRVLGLRNLRHRRRQFRVLQQIGILLQQHAADRVGLDRLLLLDRLLQCGNRLFKLLVAIDLPVRQAERGFDVGQSWSAADSDLGTYLSIRANVSRVLATNSGEDFSFALLAKSFRDFRQHIRQFPVRFAEIVFVR